MTIDTQSPLIGKPLKVVSYYRVKPLSPLLEWKLICEFDGVKNIPIRVFDNQAKIILDRTGFVLEKLAPQTPVSLLYVVVEYSNEHKGLRVKDAAATVQELETRAKRAPVDSNPVIAELSPKQATLPDASMSTQAKLELIAKLASELMEDESLPTFTRLNMAQAFRCAKVSINGDVYVPKKRGFSK